MGEETKIQWCDHTWSPWKGCSKKSPGCANCYAEAAAVRFGVPWGRGTLRPETKSWEDPLRWNRKAAFGTCRCCGSTRDTDSTGNCKQCGEVKRDFPIRTVFPSQVDWLDEDVPIRLFARFLQLIHDTPNLRWLLLTKRPEQFMPRLERASGVLGKLGEDGDKSESDVWGWAFDWIKGHPPLNVWVGTSVEDQPRTSRVSDLLKIPAVGRFLSVEPLLGPVDLERPMPWPDLGDEGSKICQPWFIQSGIDWVIIGGESGPGARPCNVEWIRSLVRQCKEASVPVFVKQLGASPTGYWVEGAQSPLPDAGWKLRITHRKGGYIDEWPKDLRVREFPEGLR